MDRRPVDGLRQLHLYRRGLSHDLHGAVAVQSVGRRERLHSDHQWHADRRHSEEYGEGGRRLQRDRQMEGRRRHGRGVRPGPFRQRERRASASPGLCGLRPAHVLPDRQAIADLWPHPEPVRSALLYRRRSVRHWRAAQHGALPDQSNEPRASRSPSRSTGGCGSRCDAQKDERRTRNAEIVDEVHQTENPAHGVGFDLRALAGVRGVRVQRDRHRQ